jgi:ADP-heptose:LPS heptosyltransferase
MSQGNAHEARRRLYERRLQQKQAIDRMKSGRGKSVPKPAPKIVRELSVKATNSPPAKLVRASTTAKTPSDPPPNSIFLSGGLGDVFAIEAFFDDATRHQLQTICHGTQKMNIIKDVFRGLSSYPNLRNHQNTWDDFSSFWCFYSKTECETKLRHHSIGKTKEFIHARDYGIFECFPKIRSGAWKYSQSTFLKERLADVSHFNLPKRYLCVCPYSSDKRITDRDFNSTDWQQLLNYLDDNDMYAVVLNDAMEHVPLSNRIIDLSRRTNIHEAIEVLKASRGYVGIDSSLSVLAAKRFDAESITVKSRNKHCYENKEIYYAPLTDFKFLKSNISLHHMKVHNGVTIRTAQGLGDIFWVYQKAAPYFDRINIEISVLEFDKVSRRSEDWMKLFPKIKNTSYSLVSSEEYQKIATDKIDMKDVVRQWKEGKDVVDYACNRWLEEGIRLDEIDDHKVEWNVPLKTEAFDLPYEEFVTLYVSGSTKNHGAVIQGAWSVDRWVDLINRLYDKLKIDLPIILIGAQFDARVMEEIVTKMPNRKIYMFVQLDPARVCHIFKKTKFFIGYQSGLNIIADNFDCPQIMLYFKSLEPMLYTWCKKENVRTRFHAFLFDQSTDEILDNLDGFTF